MRSLLVLCLLFMGGACLAQPTSWVLSSTIEVNANSVHIDQLNQVYALKKGEIVKLDDNGNEIARYSNRLIGEDIHVDVNNPLKVLVFSPQLMKLKFLDSRLSEMQDELDFSVYGFDQVGLAATSHSNGFWLYDALRFEFVRFNQHYEETARTPNVLQLLRVEFFPSQMVEFNNNLYVTDPNQGVYVFDVYGTFIKRIPVKGIAKLVISDNRLFFEKGGTLYALDLSDLNEEVVMLSGSVEEGFGVNRNRIAVIHKKAINIYQPSP